MEHSSFVRTANVLLFFTPANDNIELPPEPSFRLIEEEYVFDFST